MDLSPHFSEKMLIGILFIDGPIRIGMLVLEKKMPIGLIWDPCDAEIRGARAAPITAVLMCNTSKHMNSFAQLSENIPFSFRFEWFCSSYFFKFKVCMHSICTIFLLLYSLQSV